MTQKQFLDLLFNPDEATCFSPDAKGTQVLHAPRPNDVFFSINPLDAEKDNDPTENWHSADKPRRADANVTKHRNFLIELDNVPLSKQIPYVLEKTKVSAITFSGNKSYHFIISLLEPLTAEQYSKTASGLLRLLPLADKTTKNPSRLSRLPGVVRPDTGLFQELVYLGTRLSIEDLPELPASPHTYERTTQKSVLYVTSQLQEVLETGVDNFIANKFSGRNQFFYWLGKRLSELKYDKATKKQMVEKFYGRLQNKNRFSIAEAYAASRVKF